MIALGSLVLAFLTYHHLVVESQAAVTGRMNRAEAQRVNRDTSGLIPFPRVGRARIALSPLSFLPSLNFDNAQMLRLASPVESDETSWDLITDILKKQESGLIPFPRSGRSGTGPKRNGAGSGGSLWFGPRLGKRTYNLNNIGSADTNALTSVPDFFNQNKMAYDDSAASVKMGELQ
uniref:Cardio acceleratory peptide 2b n=3 Tax=Lygus hesperus TaxID=30085 RepID=A0A146LGE2_LYGHE|nr:periviscerokinin-like peptide precursor [Lygus hesperus]